MSMTLFNATTISSKPTGLGVYAKNALDCYREAFPLGSIIGHRDVAGKVDVECPGYCALGVSLPRALARQAWLMNFDTGPWSLVYNPTHHYIGADMSKQIVTIHDLISIEVAGVSRRQKMYFEHSLRSRASKAAGIITISENMRGKLEDWLQVPKERIYIVANCLPARYTTVFDEGYRAHQRMHDLVVGARLPHKNIEVLLSAAVGLPDSYRLIVAGVSGAYGKKLKHMARSLQLGERVVFIERPTDEELARLYRNARCLFYPSLAEGFGIPPIEALYHGCSAVLSNIPVLKESYAQVATFVSPDDILGWQRIMREGAPIPSRDSIESTMRRFSKDNMRHALVDSIVKIEQRLKRGGE